MECLVDESYRCKSSRINSTLDCTDSECVHYIKICSEKLKAPTKKEELAIYRRLLINLHSALWTGHRDKVNDYLKRIGDYSYARTNGNGHEDEEEQRRIETLLNLDK